MVETQAAPSTVEARDVFNGENVTLDEMNRYVQDGELPERFKTAAAVTESAPVDTQEETEETEAEEPEPAPDSDPEETQELPPKATPAEKRIKQLLAETNELKRQLAAKQDVKPAESSPAQPPQQFTRPKPTVDGMGPDGKPYATYEDFIDDRAMWVAEQTLEAARREQVQREGTERLNAKVEEGRQRYEDLDEVIVPAANEIYNDQKISPVIKQMIADSDCIVDLMYTIGSDKAEYAKFVKMAKENPGKAIRFIALTENLIQEELAKPRDEKGKFVSEVAPEAKKTAAPKPPSPVGGSTSRAFDVSDESLSPEEWMRKRTAQLNQRKT